MPQVAHRRMLEHGEKRQQSKCGTIPLDGFTLTDLSLSPSRLDVYVWDYLTRRGFPRAAKSLMNEAGMTEAPDVPLKTPQGLLFE